MDFFTRILKTGKLDYENLEEVENKIKELKCSINKFKKINRNIIKKISKMENRISIKDENIEIRKLYISCLDKLQK
ncbi:hypothetical protein CWI36_0106p0060 [Hamiltosporidium magnivora]|uniref:Uncharacterized protein n=1 Tax=Hamiltosporidium magnivora TaxID=148818 RepID=A0A4Q9LKC3_9MICR|nr:hypothetical protein CWI36_0106p0060 [Hamiltosporidium magnivora]